MHSHYSDEHFDAGALTRSEVMGAEHVADSGGFSREQASDLQRYVTEYGWGTIWQREHLDRLQKSLVTVAMLIALNRPHELAGHLRGALNNGCTDEQLRDLVIHASAYCGFPAALDSMRTLETVLEARTADTTAGNAIDSRDR